MVVVQFTAIWRTAGQAKLKDGSTRKGLSMTVEKAADFARAQLAAQVFAAAPCKAGLITVPELSARWP